MFPVTIPPTLLHTASRLLASFRAENPFGGSHLHTPQALWSSMVPGASFRAMIAVTGLEKSFGDHTLFRGASFRLNPGERYGLVGGNGSGKTTLLNILAGDVPESAGSVSMPARVRLGPRHLNYNALVSPRTAPSRD